MKSIKKIKWINILLFTCSILFLNWLLIDVDFYEDNFYRLFAISILTDLDYNIINQVPWKYNTIITSHFSHPSHHPIIQTPALVVTYLLELIVSFFLQTGKIREFQFAGILLNYFYLTVGFIYTQKAAKKLNVEVEVKHFLFFMFSTGLFYFTFFYLGVIEVFTFALGAFIINEILEMHFQKNSNGNVSKVLLGCSLGIALWAKVTLLPLVLLATWYVVSDYKKYLEVGKFLLGMGIIFFLIYLKDYSTFGQFYFFSKIASKIIVDYSWIDIYETVKYGVFGVGGLFFTNPAYLIAFFGFSFLVTRKMARNINVLILWAAFSALLIMSFFQTVTMVGPILDDHYLGRIQNISLPLLLFGIAYFEKTFLEKRRGLFAILFVVLGIWQLYLLTSYLAISDQGHYEYAYKKIIKDPRVLLDYIYKLVEQKNIYFNSAKIYFFALSCFTVAGVQYLLSRKTKINTFYSVFISLTVVFLVVTVGLNFVNSEKNGKRFIATNNLMDKVTVCNNLHLCLFPYVVDMFKSQLINTDNKTLREKVIQKHTDYLESVKLDLKHTSPEFRKVIDERDIGYSIYQ